ncbi:MAG: phosphatidylserine decarboxylase family protein [Acidobacteria bacterium]|nr:phosphatidylserine decarboxylase family protein [Acidobacteriota bacterium]
MVRDGYYYGLILLLSALLVGWLAGSLWGLIPLLLAIFFLWFFRDPERPIPHDPDAIVSPADGRVTHVDLVEVAGERRQRISIFLNVFDVHVNRSPVRGIVRGLHYQPGKFLNAMDPRSAESNEQNTVTIESEGRTVVFKQIAGILARRIVFTKKIGEMVERGERVGLIKFGSRTDVLLEEGAEIQVKRGDRVKGGATILAFFSRPQSQLSQPTVARAKGRS